jgi:uncharacterized protein (TIGR02996 family)
MSEKAAFLSAIRDTPDDDTPRLVMADWLQEHGEGERAEFIRLQCEIERNGRRRFKGRKAKEKRMTDLTTRLGSRLIFGNFDSMPSGQKNALRKIVNVMMLQRGFIEGMSIAAASPNLPLLFEEQPIRHLRLTDSTEQNIVNLQQQHHEYLSQVFSLSVAEHVFPAMMESNTYGKLEELHLGNDSNDRNEPRNPHATVSYLLDRQAPSSLRTIDFGLNYLSIQLVERLITTRLNLTKVHFLIPGPTFHSMPAPVREQLEKKFPDHEWQLSQGSPAFGTRIDRERFNP